ncbi:MAG: NAD(P)H-binding protein [Anaerolineae bacterium]
MKHAITGAFGYSGSYIARRLLDAGEPVITLTNTPRKPNSPDITAYPLRFDDSLIEALRGVDVLHNTYWVRFNHQKFTHHTAVENTLKLFDAAKRAGVRRIVHVSITNPNEQSPFEYFRGKGRLERALKESGLSYAILRPAVLFGGSDILINNIAWMLRHLPVFGVFGDGRYRLQPIHVDDLARLSVEQTHGTENVTLNAIGPETFTYRELAETLERILNLRRPIISVPPEVGYVAGKLIGTLMHDVTITREEIGGLMADLLYADAPPTGSTCLTDWARDHRDMLKRHYASELARR